MKRLWLLSIITLSFMALSVRADLLDCEEKTLPSLSDVPVVGRKIDSGDSKSTEQVRDFFKSVGCKIKKGAATVSEHAKKFGSDIKERAIKLSETAKEKYDNLKDRLSSDSSDEDHAAQGLLRNVEIINPDVLKAEQQCGHGHILDALGNCSKLRK